MKFQYYLSALVILNETHWIRSQDANTSDINNTYRTSDKLTICSTALSTLIDNLCSKTTKVVKRDTISLMMEKLTPKDLLDHMNKQRLLSTERWRRVRRQIASECCERPCTIGNIILYCPDNAKLVQENPDIFY